MNPNDRLMTLAQIWLSAIFLTGTFVMTVIYELGLAHLSQDQDRTFGNSLNWMQGAALIVLYFWFQRTRVGGVPDPSQVVTQTHTLPDGTKTVTTAPVIPSTPSNVGAVIKLEGTPDPKASPTPLSPTPPP